MNNKLRDWISNIDDDRIEVRSKIEESLKKLIKETLVQKNGEIYIFLTNEEQEINNAINNESVEMGEIIGEASTVIFEEIYTEKKYRYSSRYLFPFNQKVDDRFFKGNQSNDIGVTVITPYGGDYADSALRLLSAQESSVIVKLPNDSTFLDEITESIKIYKFLNKNYPKQQRMNKSLQRKPTFQLNFKTLQAFCPLTADKFRSQKDTVLHFQFLS